MNKVKIYSNISEILIGAAPWIAGYFAISTSEYRIAFIAYLVVTAILILFDILLRKEINKLNGEKIKPRKLFTIEQGDKKNT